jgi:hypothetical protein
MRGYSVGDDMKLPEIVDHGPMLQMDGIRIATLAVLAVDTLVVVLLAVFLVTNVQDQRQVNECYQRQIVALTEWAKTAVEAGRTDRQAQRELLLSRATTPDDRQAVLDRYLAQLDEADRTRRSVPVPEQRCSR